MNEPILTISSEGNVQVANNNFMRFFNKNAGGSQQGRKLLGKLRTHNKKKRLCLEKEASDQLLNFKLFRVVRDYDDNDHNEGINLARRIASAKKLDNFSRDQFYSINELRRLGQKFVKDKVFESH